MNELMRAFLYHSSVVEVRTPLSLEPAAEKECFVKLAPQNKDLYRGLLADATIQPTVIGGTWFPSPYSPSTDSAQNVVLYFHGGAFVIGEGRSAVTGFAAATLAQSFKAKVLSFSYRLSSNPHSQFPAALQDAITAYQHLLDQHIDASNIILAGDSAGCTVAIALLRFIADNRELLPHPLAAVLSSPWVNVFAAHDPAYALHHHNPATDYVPGNLQAWGARTYIPDHADAADPYISPHGHPFRTNTILWFCLGGLEMLRDEGIEFAESMRREGNSVEVHVEPYANHAILGVGNITGFKPETEKAIGRAAQFVLGGRR